MKDRFDNRDADVEPMSDADFELACALARIRKTYGSLAAFGEAMRKKEREEKKAKRDAQWATLAAI